MPITPADVKLYESQVLSDEDDGGGRATGNVIQDGVINNLFPDISRLDRTLGDVALRKAFLGIDTDNQDVYLGAHAIIVQPPADERVSVVIFDAGSENDERLDAQNRIESYVVRGASAQFDLLGSQYEGQRSIVAFQREEQAIPEVGDVYLIENAANGDLQYIRITEVEHQVQTFTVILNQTPFDFERRRLDLGISSTLKVTFPGGEVYPDGPFGDHADIYQTEVADAARYWGVTTSTEEITNGDVTINANSIYASLVPSAQAESPIADASFFTRPTDPRIAAASDTTEGFSLSYVSATNVIGYMRRPAVRGTVSLSISGSTYQDNDAGILERISGSAPWAELKINYASGTIEGVRTSGTGSGTVSGTITYRSGAPFSGLRQSVATPITINNRGFTYIDTFPELKPRPGTMVISYMALGKWYTVTDNGAGVFEGFGSGTINFTTGTLTVTLDAMPDVGTKMIFEWVADFADEVTQRTGVIAENGEIVITAENAIDPGSLVVTYTAGVTDYTLNDTASTGILAGDGTGIINYSTGEIRFKPTITPNDASGISIAYDTLGADTYNDAAPTVTAGTASGTIPGGPFKPGTIVAKLNQGYRTAGTYGTARIFERVVVDDGLGGWIGWNGTIDYTTGAYTIEVESNYSRDYQRTRSYWDSNTQTRVYYREAINYTRSTTLSGPILFNFSLAGAAGAPNTESIPYNAISFKLFDDYESLLPGSLRFTFGGKDYIDRDGIIYTDFVQATGAATAVGTVNYQDATVTLDAWPDNAAAGLTITAAGSVTETVVTSQISFRTGGAPLRPQSLIVTVTDEDGNIISETAALDGSITGPSVAGTVNVENGVVDLEFTDGVDPIYVHPETGRYSGIVLSFLPLDADLIGLDPVRLPGDGKVPVFREGDVIVISHTTETDAGTPTAGQQVVLSRDRQASLVVKDANGVELDPAMYTANLVTGTVTFADPLTLQDADLNALTTPLAIHDRIEHMSVVNDVQITGDLSFIAPTAHTFPVGSIISSAKVWGDVNARVFNFFTQKTWNSGTPNWTGDRIGDDTTANYNIVDNPIEFANNGAITEKWALVFTSATTFNIVGQTLGVIGTGNTSTDVAPNNPNTSNPYFVMRAAGFGAGWAAGNVIRFDAEGCLAPLWIARTVLSGSSTEDDDQFVLQVRGDAD
jgi:hypothetical protein